jgi:hypothetical protein
LGLNQYKIDEGLYELLVYVDAAKGNSKYGISLLMPETITYEFAEPEVPLSVFASPQIIKTGLSNIPQTKDAIQKEMFVWLMLLLIAGLLSAITYRKAKPGSKN